MSRNHTHNLLRGNENCEYMCKSSLYSSTYIGRRYAGSGQSKDETRSWPSVKVRRSKVRVDTTPTFCE